MKATWTRPGTAALVNYARRVMEDGKPRISADLVNRAKDDGMIVSPQEAGSALGSLVPDFLDVEFLGSTRIWQIKRKHLEAAE